MGRFADMATQHGSSEFTVADRKFRFVSADFQANKTTPDEIVVLKNIYFFELYDPILAAAPGRNMLEFGIFEGGSAILFALAHPRLKIVGVDISAPSEAVLRHVHDLGLSERVKLYYNTSQTDEQAVEKIISDEFGAEELAIISDDASHDYAFSKVTFELTFGRLCAGGFYCLEDWGWAHWDDYQTTTWIDKPALSNLLFEFVAMSASTSGLVSGMNLHSHALVSLRRGGVPIGKFRINDLLKMRGKTLTLI